MVNPINSDYGYTNEHGSRPEVLKQLAKFNKKNIKMSQKWKKAYL